MKKILTTLSLICFLFISQSKASHIAGGDLSYVCLGGNQYQINLNLFVDCLGFDPGTLQTINFTSTCGGSTSTTVNCNNPGGTEISQLCPSMINNSTCNGGTLPGMWVFHYTGTVTLAPPCDTWTMSWTTCCRNAAVLNLVTPSSFGSYIEATLNSATAPCNNSPSFTAQPIPYVCSGQLVNYSYGVVETDGDSLNYSLVGAMDAGGTLLTYAAGYSATSPIPGIVINPITGMITFTPTTLGNFVVVVLVKEYDSNGNLIGTVMRDIQFIVQTCSNVVPDPTAGAITGITGSAVQTGPFSIELCEGSTFTFNATFNDANPGDSLVLFSNIDSVLAGATLTYTGSNPAVATVNWTAPAGSANTNTTFSITVNDGACPVPGQQTFIYDINVNPRTLGGPDHILCGAQTATLNGTGGSVFNWVAISGPPIVVGTNFSCNPCSNPVASPTVTTVYEVTSDLSGTCVNKDTVTVTVVPDYTFTTSQSSTSSCLLQPIQLNSTVSPAGAYTYSWSPSTYLSSTSIPNPIASITTPGNYSYVLSLTSPLGCVKKDTLSFTVTPNYPPNPIIVASDTTVCVGDTVSLITTFGSSVPSVCGINPVGCTAALAATVGTPSGSNTTTTYPALFGNWWTSTKHQMLFLASEMNAAGITGGKIDQIDFDVTAINGATSYHQFTIRMGCTSLSALGTTWESGLFQVFDPATVNVVLGTNTFVFNNAYEWDGISNIIIEVCSTEGPPYPNFTQNSVSPFTTTSFTSCLYGISDANDMCPDVTAFINQLNDRPILKFHYCGTAPDSTRYDYAWYPSIGAGAVFNPSNQNTAAQLPGNTQYLVVVTDTVSGCLDTAYVNIVAQTTTLSVSAGVDTTICPGASTQLNATGASNFVWSPPATLSNNSISNPIATPVTTTTYTVVGTSACAAGSASASVTITIDNLVNLTVDAGLNDTICPGTTSSNLIGSGATSYVWSPSTGLSSTTAVNPIATPASTITYTVTGSAYCADPVTDSVTVNVLTAPALTVLASPDQTICLGESFSLSSAANGGFGNNAYMWSYSGISGDTITNPFSTGITMTSSQAGTYTYQIIVTDKCGYSTTDYVVVDVLQDCDLTIPNVFTPNGDGKNDAFVVTGNGISTYSIVIYNRWGIKEYESSDITASWTGSGASDGTFYYIIKASTISGKTYEKTGYLQLLGNK